MDAKQRVDVAGRQYEQFDQSSEWAREPLADTLILYLPGFRKEQLKVQITSTRNLRISGERHIAGNKWSRFQKELPVASNYDTNEISAKFEGGTLFVRLPKIITPVEPHQADSPPKKATEATNPKIPQEMVQPRPPSQPQPLRQVTKPEKTSSKQPEEAKSKIGAPPEVTKPEKTSSKQPEEAKSKIDKKVAKGDVVADTSSFEKPKNGKPESLDTVMNKTTAETNDKINEGLAEGNESTVAQMSIAKSGGVNLNYKQLIDDLKKPRKLMNMAVIALFLLVIVLSAKRAIMSLLQSNTADEQLGSVASETDDIYDYY